MVDKLHNSDIPEKEIMILTPYRAHKDHIRELLPTVNVNTVHESQGY